jgi:hypothetical protein
MSGTVEMNLGQLSVRETLFWFLDLAAQYARSEADAANGRWILAQLPPYRRAADFPLERDVLHALEKLLWHARAHVLGNARLLARVAPFVAAALRHRGRLGGHGLLSE